MNAAFLGIRREPDKNARAARRLPAISDALRSGRVHMTGLRLLAPHLYAENVEEVLAKAAGRSTREIEELVASLAPKAPVPTVIRRLPAESIPQLPSPTLFDAPAPQSSAGTSSAAAAVPTPLNAPPTGEHRTVLKPLAQDTYKFQFTASRACHEKLRHAQGLLRHRIPNGDVGTIIERALDVLIDQVTKERFATGRTPRTAPADLGSLPGSRHIPDAIKREVFQRHGGRCALTDEHGRRCSETNALEFDHVNGFARTRRHRAEDIRLLCRAHNQRAAENMYGRAFMERARRRTAHAPPLTATPDGES